MANGAGRRLASGLGLAGEPDLMEHRLGANLSRGGERPLPASGWRFVLIEARRRRSDRLLSLDPFDGFHRCTLLSHPLYDGIDRAAWYSSFTVLEEVATVPQRSPSYYLKPVRR